MEKSIDQEERAGKAWIRLIQLASGRSRCTYKELGESIGIHHRAVQFALAPIQEYCWSNGLPPLTILVINASGRPGSGFFAAAPSEIELRTSDVYSFNWSENENPFDLRLHGIRESDVVEKLVNNQSIETRTLALIIQRGASQRIFRKALLQAYHSKCAVCSLSVESVLEAAHIIPYSESNDEQKIAVTNGILLCSLHHKLFDSGYLRIDEEYKVRISKKIQDTEANRTIINVFNGRMINLPVNYLNYPNKESLRLFT